MKIKKVELYHISIPLKNNFYPTWIPGYPQTHNRFTLLRLETDNDITGLASGVAFGEEREGLGGLMAPYLLGLDPTDTSLVHQRLKEGSYLGWRNNWMETAFFDIKAKFEDKPVWKMLGGSDKPIPVYWSTGEQCEPKKHSKIIQQAQDDGYYGVKIRIKNKTIEEDVRAVKETRVLVNEDYPLMIDVNQGWPVTIVDRIPFWDISRAKKFVNEISDQNIRWLEEPLDWHAYEDLATLRNYSPIKIAGCELNAGWHEARMFLSHGSLDIYQPDATVFGIVDALRTLKATKKDPSISFSPHTWTNGLGLLVNLHICALTDRNIPLEFPYEPNSWEPKFRDGLFDKPIFPKDGLLELPHDSGFGFPVDWKKVDKYGKKFFSMTESELSKKVLKEKGLITALKLKRRKSKGSK